MKRLINRAYRVSVKIKSEFQTATSRINSCPILVLGNQKSGTSAIAALLGEIAGLSVTIDLEKEIKNPTYDRVWKGELPFAEFININKFSFSREIVKEPNLTPFHQQLTEYFPNSKFVFVLRDPRDNIRSILNRLRIPGDLAKLEEKHRDCISPAWDLVINGQWLGLQGGNYIEMLAARWNFMADVYLKSRNTMVLIRYEEFLKDKIGVIASLAQGLGLAPIRDISNKVNVPFQPPGERGVRWRDFFGEDNLTRIIDICRERMKLLGYALRREREDPVCVE